MYSKYDPAQLALAWLLAQKPWIVPIPGTRKFHRLDENIGTVDIELTAEDLSEIKAAMASRASILGKQRYLPIGCKAYFSKLLLADDLYPA